MKKFILEFKINADREMNILRDIADITEDVGRSIIEREFTVQELSSPSGADVSNDFGVKLGTFKIVEE